MVLKRGLIAIVIAVVGYLTAGSHAVVEVADPVLSQYYIETTNDAVMMKVAEKFEVTRRADKGFIVIVPERRSDELKKLVPTAELQLADIRSEISQKLNKDGVVDGYRSFAEVGEYLAQLETNYPELVKGEIYGYSRQGRPLYALKISDNVMTDEDEPELMLTAATHGDELITVEVLLGLVDQILSGYGTDERFTSFLNHTEMYILPVINPDGFSRQSRYANGVDPNRDYPWPDRPDVESVECIAGLRDFFHAHDFVGSMDFHASGMMIMYPWAYTFDRIETADDSRLDALTTQMASTNGYAHGPIAEVIYVARGSSADYYYWQNRTDAIAIEIGRTKVPPAAQIPGMIRENSESTWKWIESFIDVKDRAH